MAPSWCHAWLNGTSTPFQCNKGWHGRAGLIAGWHSSCCMPLQAVSYLLSFPAAHPAMPAPSQQGALLAMLPAFCPRSAFSALTLSTSPEQPHSTFPSEPDPEDQPCIEEAVVPALGAMAALGHESLLQSIALPVLYTTAQLHRLSCDQSNSKPGQLSGLDDSSQTNVADSHQAVSYCMKCDQWRRDVALRALARIACVSSSLRQPILARLTEAIPLALAGAEPMCSSWSRHGRTHCFWNTSLCTVSFSATAWSGPI